MTTIERCIDFVAEWDPRVPSTLCGAPVAAIEALEEHMGRPCSPTYRELLEVIGEDTGDLDLGPYTTSVEILMQRRAVALRRLPEGVELLAMARGDSDEDLFLVVDDDPSSTMDPKIFGHPSLQLAETGEFDLSRAEPVGRLAEVLCLPVVNRCYAVHQPLQIAMTDEDGRHDTLERCCELADRFGLERYWFSNEWTYAGVRGSVLVVARQAPGWFFSVGVAGVDRFAWAAVAGTLRHRLGLEVYR
ncbi:MAG: hypothetical protein AAGF11_12810 [Myxococcota bacterium]